MIDLIEQQTEKYAGHLFDILCQYRKDYILVR